MQWNEFLGGYFGEERVKRLFDALNLTGQPKLKRGDEDAFIKNQEAGIEVTFTDESALEESSRDYPENSLVLTNIRFYGPRASKNFGQYPGDLPNGLKYGMTYQDAVSVLGPEGGNDPDKSFVRWDLPDYVLFGDFGDADRLNIVSVQLAGA